MGNNPHLMKIFRSKFLIFFLVLLKHRLWEGVGVYIVRTMLGVNQFCYMEVGFKGYTFHRHVI